MVTTRATNRSRDTNLKRSKKQVDLKEASKKKKAEKTVSSEGSLENLQKQVRQDRRWSLKKYKPNKKPDSYFEEGKYVLVKYSFYPWWPSRIVRREEIPQDISKRLAKYKGLAVQFLPSRDYAIIQMGNVGCLDLYECIYILESNRFSSYIRQTIEIIADSIKNDCSFSDAEETEEEDEQEEEEDEAGEEFKEDGTKQIPSSEDEGKDTTIERTYKKSNRKEGIGYTSPDSGDRHIRNKNKTVPPTQASPGKQLTKKESEKEAARASLSPPKLPVFSFKSQLDQPLSTTDLYAQAYYARAKILMYYCYKLQRILLCFNHYPTESEMTDVHSILEKLENFSGLNAELIENTKLFELFSQLKELSDLQLEHRYHFVDRFHVLFTYFLKLLNKPNLSTLETNPLNKNEIVVNPTIPA